MQTKIQNQGTSGTCFVCNEVITNPICPECLKKQMKIWLTNKAPKLTPILEIQALSEPEEDNIKCILCGEGMEICNYCYTTEIHELIKLHEPRLAQEFEMVFGLNSY